MLCILVIQLETISSGN